MADKNVRLKSGNDVLYPQTKVGNILNDDGSKFERYINFDKYLSSYSKITQEGFDYLLRLKDNKNFIGIHINENNYNFIGYGEKQKSDGTLDYQYMAFSGRIMSLEKPINGDIIINSNLNIERGGYYETRVSSNSVEIASPDGTKAWFNYLDGVSVYNHGNVSQSSWNPVLSAYATQASNGYIKKINIRSNEYKIPDTVYFDIASNSDSENPNTLTSDGLSNLNDLFTNNRLIGIIYENMYYKLSKNDISNNNYIFVCVDFDNNNYSLKIFTINSTTGVYSSNEMIPSNR